jgi:hypothetical protein
MVNGVKCQVTIVCSRLDNILLTKAKRLRLGTTFIIFCVKERNKDSTRTKKERKEEPAITEERRAALPVLLLRGRFRFTSTLAPLEYFLLAHRQQHNPDIHQIRCLYQNLSSI